MINLERPTDVKGTRRMLGMVGFYQMFIPNFGHITGPFLVLAEQGLNNKYKEWW